MSARYDITHGIGLAILTPRLLRYFLEKAPEFLDRFAGFAERVMGLRADEFDSCEALAEAGLVKLEAFYKSIGVLLNSASTTRTSRPWQSTSRSTGFRRFRASLFLSRGRTSWRC